jgi:hypothetical protein
MSLISASDWEAYKDAINTIHHSFNQTKVIWKNKTSNFNRFGEDPSGQGGNFIDIELDVLVLSNYFRTWPINKTELIGEEDKQNMTLIINYKYLKDLGYVTDSDYFNFNPDLDRFLVKGRYYKAWGDIDVSYANGEPLLFYINLERDKTFTGNPLIP